MVAVASSESEAKLGKQRKVPHKFGRPVFILFTHYSAPSGVEMEEKNFVLGARLSNLAITAKRIGLCTCKCIASKSLKGSSESVSAILASVRKNMKTFETLFHKLPS